MTYADLIQQRLQTLSPAQQAEVFDFVEFLASRAAVESAVSPPPAVASLPERLPMWLDDSRRVPAFEPLSRDEANAR